MERHTTDKRENWQSCVESQGLLFHTTEVEVPGDYRSDGGVKTEQVSYWNEGVYYRFTPSEIDKLEAATVTLHEMCMTAAQHVIDTKSYAKLGIPPELVPLIEQSWNDEPPGQIYGRLDLAYTREGGIKLLEYNGDTPTSLIEAGVVQWRWLEDVFGEDLSNVDQWNSLHDKLVAKWKQVKSHLHRGDARGLIERMRGGAPPILHFTYHEGTDAALEDLMTVSYLRDCANQAGIETKLLGISQVGWDGEWFVDDNGKEIRNLFKLYPWEWLIKEEFGQHVVPLAARMHWIEPAWKLLLSSKGLLAVLWEQYHGHELLLAANFDAPPGPRYVRKPLFSREGNNVAIYGLGGDAIETQGPDGEGGFVYQEYVELPRYDGQVPVLGSWLVDGEAAGMGIRETSGLITDNTASFTPHIIRK